MQAAKTCLASYCVNDCSNGDQFDLQVCSCKLQLSKQVQEVMQLQVQSQAIGQVECQNRSEKENSQLQISR
jgi:hypothetical protein